MVHAGGSDLEDDGLEYVTDGGGEDELESPEPVRAEAGGPPGGTLEYYDDEDE